MNRKRWLCWGLVLGLGAVYAAGSNWLQKVPAAVREKKNPYAGQQKAIAAGARMFAEHCAPCHGQDALGRGERPSLRSPEVQQATDGEIFWLLKNGYRRRGMPSWSSLPEPTRWQIIAYVKSLGVSTKSTSGSRKEEQR